MASFKKRGRPAGGKTANPEKRLPAVKAETEKVSKTIAKKTIQKKKKAEQQDEIMMKAKRYHKLKKQVLAPFIARLLLRHRWEEMTTNLDEEFTMFDLHTSATLPSRNGNSTVNFTLDPINEEDEDDDKSVGSHGEDWRSQEVSSGSTEPESD